MASPDTIANATTDGNQVDRRMLIGGNLVESGSGRRFASLNPATGEVLGHAPDATVADAEAAVAAARTAFDATDWATNTELRVRCLQQLHAALVEHRGEMGQLTTDEVGATPALLAGAQYDQPVEIVRYYAELLKTYPMTDDLGNIESRGMLLAATDESGGSRVVSMLTCDRDVAPGSKVS